VHVGLQVLAALAYAHDAFGLVHRDVTPRNIMIDTLGHVRLLDFGIAAPIANDGSGRFGSIGYMSPEQVRNEPVDGRSDLFALGAVLYEACMGRPAFTRDSMRAFEQEILGGVVSWPGDHPLASTLGPLLDPSVEGRPPSAQDAERQLRTWLSANAPEGVAPGLGRRVRETMSSHADQEPRSPMGSEAPLAGQVRSLATSPILADLLGATQPITGRRPGVPPGEPTPTGDRRWTRATAWTGALVLALVLGAAWVSNRWAGNSSATGEAPSKAESEPPGRNPTATFVNKQRDRVDNTTPPQEVRGPDAPDEPPSHGQDGLPSNRRDEHPAASPIPGSPDVAPKKSPANHAGGAHTSVVSTPSGVLHVNATPWARVSIDQRPVGTTPLRGLRPAAGKRNIVLRCPPLGREFTTTIEVEAGKTTRLVVDLTKEPPEAQTTTE
ncbi:MAG: protein kinase, partial [Myxococcales bacterium]|nr:protein kinase [Myxococcales bacterium]